MLIMKKRKSQATEEIEEQNQESNRTLGGKKYKSLGILESDTIKERWKKKQKWSHSEE